MGDRKSQYDPQSSLPIPSYEEATSSRPSSSQSYLGPTEASHDAERQGLLRHELQPSPGHSGYRPPTVESARSSLDFLPSSNGSSRRNSDAGLRQEMEEFEITDPPVDGVAQMGARVSKHISSLTSRLSFLRLPFLKYIPSLDRGIIRLPPFPEAFKPGWIMVIRFLALLLILSLGYVLFFSDLLHIRRRGGYSVNLEQVRHHVMMHINETQIRANLEHASRFDHIAGTEGSFFLANWIKAEMEKAQLEDVHLERFDVYLNYPNPEGRRISIIHPPENAFVAKLEEEQAYKDQPREQTLVFHGYSRSGNVTGPLVYANYGSRDDFRKLEEDGINVKGSIALVRYYGTQGDRALKVKAAEQAGAVGCIVYSDPNEDGFKRGKTFPDGPWRPEDSVQRGSVGLTSWIAGDPLSPGFPSLPDGGERVPKENNPGLTNIPSLPIAWRDAQPLLQSLEGYGQKITEDDWIGGVPNVEWWTGDKESPIVHLQNELEEVERRPIFNVLGRIEGLEQPEKKIIIGNHYDAWCFGGADPGSGTAVFVEMVRIFGELKLLGWRPRRTIEFASWDGEEYNLIGSTEHVEGRINELRKDGFAYINVDVAVTGDDFNVAASPILEKALLGVLNHVGDPKTKETLRHIWNKKEKRMETLGAGSDYLAFQNLAGTSSIDMTFSGSGFPYHSCYDNFDWVDKFGDPGFQYHKTIAQIWALLVLQLSDEPLLPFDLNRYADAISEYITSLESLGNSTTREKSEPPLDVQSLRNAQSVLKENAQKFHNWEESWYQSVEGMGGLESTAMTLDRLKYNTNLAKFETDLLDIDGGLPGREQFKHVLFAPEAWSGYDGATFPGVRDALDARDWKGAQDQVDKVAAILLAASENILV